MGGTSKNGLDKLGCSIKCTDPVYTTALWCFSAFYLRQILKEKILTIITIQRKEFGTFYFVIDVLKSGSEPRTYSESGSGTVHQIRIKISHKPEPNLIRIRRHTPESMEPQIRINTDNGWIRTQIRFRIHSSVGRDPQIRVRIHIHLPDT